MSLTGELENLYSRMSQVRDQINGLVAEYQIEREEASRTRAALKQAEQNLEQARAMVVVEQNLAANNRLNGKNADLREAQLLTLLHEIAANGDGAEPYSIAFEEHQTAKSANLEAGIALERTESRLESLKLTLSVLTQQVAICQTLANLAAPEGALK